MSSDFIFWYMEILWDIGGQDIKSYVHVQSTLFISTSVISNNRLSRRENLIPVLT